MLVNFLLAGILRSVVTERKKIILSALDQSPVRSGGTATDALLETVELAQACEAAGYHRYWVAEHHASTALAGPAPEIMISQIANATKTIRVGSGGVMLSHYSPQTRPHRLELIECDPPGREVRPLLWVGFEVIEFFKHRVEPDVLSVFPPLAANAFSFRNRSMLQ